MNAQDGASGFRRLIGYPVPYSSYEPQDPAPERRQSRPAPESSPLSPFVCLCTCPDTASANAIAEALVERRLAACVNLLPGVRSVYRWQGTVERADEVLLVIKSSGARRDALIARIAELHPYDLPEIIALDIAAGLPGYLQWIVDSTTETRP